MRRNPVISNKAAGTARARKRAPGRWLAPLAGLLAAAALFAAPAAEAADNVIPDASFRSCLNTYLHQSASADVTAAQLQTLTGQVTCDGAERSTQIASLAGAEYLTGVTGLALGSNTIADLSPLAGLTQLTSLDVLGNAVTSLEPLANLTNLTRLDVRANQITGLGPLAGLAKLERLYADSNRIADLTPLAGLTNLTRLWLGDNEIQDLAPLAGLTHLTEVSLENNQIASVEPLAHADGLTLLYLNGNKVSDLSVLPAGLVPQKCTQNNVCSRRVFATGQDATAELPVGTSDLPLAQLTSSAALLNPVVASGSATINESAGTITINAPGTVVITWTTTGPAYFSGTLTITVRAPTPTPTPTPPPSSGTTVSGGSGTVTNPAAGGQALPETGLGSGLNNVLTAVALFALGLLVMALWQLARPLRARPVPLHAAGPGRHSR